MSPAPSAVTVKSLLEPGVLSDCHMILSEKKLLFCTKYWYSLVLKLLFPEAIPDVPTKKSALPAEPLIHSCLDSE